MLKLVQNLEPRKFEKNELIFYETEEVEEVLFICSGEVSLTQFFSDSLPIASLTKL